MVLNKFKYDKINILGKCSTEETFQVDMLYNATTTDRAINGKMVRFVNFFFNPKPFGDEKKYINIMERIVEKNNYMSDFKIKSLEVNFDYSTESSFDRLEMLGKIIASVLSDRGYKTLNINADIVGFDYRCDEFQERFRSYKWYKPKGKNKFLEVKLYRKTDNVNRFEVIFHNVDCRHFKTLDETLISSGARINKTFNKLYDDIYTLLELDKDLWNDEGIAEFMNSFRMALDEAEIQRVA